MSTAIERARDWSAASGLSLAHGESPLWTRHAAYPSWDEPQSRTLISKDWDYCLSNTKTEVKPSPSAFVPFVVVVIVFPPFETTRRLVP